MSTPTLENAGAKQVPAEEHDNPRNHWVSQAPLATLAACATTFALFLGSRRKA